MTTVLCVWSGSGKYGPEYPERLGKAINKWLSGEKRLISISHRPVAGWDHVQTDSIGPREGCWHKLELFRPGLVQPGERCLFLDLDVVIIGALDALVTDGIFRAMQDPRPWTMNSSVMSWIVSPATEHIWHEWKRLQPCGKPNWRQDGYKGDQEFIQHMVHPHWDVMPHVHGYKMGPPPAGTSVVVFYGNPKMTALPPQHELRRVWEDGSSD